MRTPHPAVVADIQRTSDRRYSASDIESWWLNAVRNFMLRPEFSGENEPPEVTAARTLWVRGHMTTDVFEAQEIFHGMWVLLGPFTQSR